MPTAVAENRPAGPLFDRRQTPPPESATEARPADCDVTAAIHRLAELVEDGTSRAEPPTSAPGPAGPTEMPSSAAMAAGLKQLCEIMWKARADARRSGAGRRAAGILKMSRDMRYKTSNGAAR